MAITIYLLCTLTAFTCAWMLLSSYFRIKYRLLLWSGLCFIGLFANNLFLVIDQLIGPGIDLSRWRLLMGLISLLFLLYGLIWEDDSL